MISTSELKIGTSIRYNGEAYKVIRCEFMNPGKGVAVYRTKLQGIKSSRALEVTFKSGEMVEDVSVESRRAQFLYNTGSAYAFMDNENFEQYEIPAESIGEKGKFLQDGMEIFVQVLEGVPFDVQLPPKMVFKVESTPPGVKGDTASGGTKAATLENGVVVNVPLFVKEGDKVRINTELGTYVERVQD